MEQEIERFVQYYNHERVHESLRNLTPADVDQDRERGILSPREKLKRQTLRRRVRSNRGLRVKTEGRILLFLYRAGVSWVQAARGSFSLTTYTRQPHGQELDRRRPRKSARPTTWAGGSRRRARYLASSIVPGPKSHRGRDDLRDVEERSCERKGRPCCGNLLIGRGTRFRPQGFAARLG